MHFASNVFIKGEDFLLKFWYGASLPSAVSRYFVIPNAINLGVSIGVCFWSHAQPNFAVILSVWMVALELWEQRIYRVGFEGCDAGWTLPSIGLVNMSVQSPAVHYDTHLPHLLGLVMHPFLNVIQNRFVRLHRDGCHTSSCYKKISTQVVNVCVAIFTPKME